MATGDIQPYENSSASKMDGAIKFYVKANSFGSSGSVSRIKPGEPVQKRIGATSVYAAINNFPTTTLLVVGVAASTSTETASVDGSVDVIPASPGQIWMIAPKVAATWDTQSEYNALVGSRVLVDNTTGTYTMLATDAAGNGCIVEYLDVAKYPGMVAFSWAPNCDYRNSYVV